MAIPVADLNGSHLGLRAVVTTGQDTITGIIIRVDHRPITETTLGRGTVIVDCATTLTMLHDGREVRVEYEPPVSVHFPNA